MNFKLKQAQLAFGLECVEDLPSFACELIEDNFENQNLYVLAGLDKKEIREIWNYWELFLEDHKVPIFSKQESAWILINHYLDLIINNKTHPYDGMHAIVRDIYDGMGWDENNREYVGDSIEIQKLYGLFNTYEELGCATSRWYETKSNDQLRKETLIEIINEARAYKAFLQTQQKGSPNFYQSFGLIKNR